MAARVSFRQSLANAIPHWITQKWYEYVSLHELISQIQSPFNRTKYIDVDPPFKMPSNVTEVEAVLEEIAARENLPSADRSRLIGNIIANFCSALTAGRLPGKVTILLVGETGQGKSATINKLVGQRLLKVGRDESTTKEIDSVTVSAVRNGISVALAFDDTPGLQDTTVADREANAILFKRYCEDTFYPTANTKAIHELEHFLKRIKYDQLISTLKPTWREDTYPNAIILAVRWDQVKHDAQNDLGQFTTPIGRSIWMLHNSKLFDSKRPNVIVVVTRSLTDPGDYLDGKRGTTRFDEQWRVESYKKGSMILAIQKKVFPEGNPWPVVFVENGGNARKFAHYETLPNEEQSHQNLFEAMRDLFDYEDSTGGRDLLGLQALSTVLSGAKPHASGTVEAKTLHRRLNDGEMLTEEERKAALAYIGETAEQPASSPASSCANLRTPSPRPGSPSPAEESLKRAENAMVVGAMLEKNQDGFWVRLTDSVRLFRSAGCVIC